MQERPDTATPKSTDAPATAQSRSVDRFPRDPVEWARFAALPPAERAAVYLRSIRTMLFVLTTLVVLGVIAGVVIGLLNLHSGQSSNPFG